MCQASLSTSPNVQTYARIAKRPRRGGVIFTNHAHCRNAKQIIPLQYPATEVTRPVEGLACADRPEPRCCEGIVLGHPSSSEGLGDWLPDDFEQSDAPSKVGVWLPSQSTAAVGVRRLHDHGIAYRDGSHGRPVCPNTKANDEPKGDRLLPGHDKIVGSDSIPLGCHTVTKDALGTLCSNDLARSSVRAACSVHKIAGCLAPPIPN